MVKGCVPVSCDWLSVKFICLILAFLFKRLLSAFLLSLKRQNSFVRVYEVKNTNDIDRLFVIKSFMPQSIMSRAISLRRYFVCISAK